MGYIRLMFAAIMLLTMAVCFWKYILAPLFGWIHQTPAPMPPTQPAAPAAPQASAPQAEPAPAPSTRAKKPQSNK